MIPFPRILLIVLFSANATDAEVIKITSGEHDGFTRIVLSVNQLDDWDLITTGQLVELHFPNQVHTVESSELFTRISKDRLNNIVIEQREQSTVLKLFMNCLCEVKAFTHLEQYVVVDIFPPVEIEVSQLENQHQTPSLELPIAVDMGGYLSAAISWNAPRAPSYRVSPLTVDFPQSNFTKPFVGLPNNFQHEKLLIRQTSTTQSTEFTSNAPIYSDVIQVEDPAEIKETIDAARNSLIEQLMMAADQGLLDFTPQERAEPAKPEVSRVEPIEIQSIEEFPINTDQVNIQTVFDRDAGLAGKPTNKLNNVCPTEESLDIASWGSGSDYNAELSTIRGNLFKEFDVPDIVEVQNLIKLNLRYGFGVEAVSYLTEYKDHISNYDLFMDLANVLEGKAVVSGGPLERAVGCNGSAGLWSVVGRDPLTETDMGDVTSIIDAFAAMPSDLRRMIGAKLEASFLKFGHGEASERVSDIIERAPGENSSEHELFVANVALSEGDFSDAEDMLTDLIDQNSLQSVDALISLANMQLKNHQPASSSILVDLGAAADEARGSQNGEELRRLEILWTAKLSGGDEALDIVANEIEADPDNARQIHEIANVVLMGMSPTDDALLKYVGTVNKYQHLIDKSPSGDTLRLEIGEELITSGLPSMAVIILEPTITRQSTEGKLLAAKAYLAMYRDDLALEILQNVSGDVARRYRIQAYLSGGMFEAALIELVEMQNPNMQIVKPEWFSGDWAQAEIDHEAAAEIQRKYIGDQSKQDVFGLSDTDLVKMWESNSAAGTIESLSEIRSVLAKSNELSASLQESLLMK